MEEQLTQTENTETKQEEQKPVPPEVQAVIEIRQLLPEFRRRLAELNRSAHQRILSAMVEFPLEHETPNFVTQEEEVVFKLGNMIQDRKFVLFLHSLEEKMNQAEAQAEATNQENTDVQVQQVQESKPTE